jgi:predicted RNA methylase
MAKYSERMIHENQRPNGYNGICFGLLEDAARNKFYDESLKRAKGKRVVDVGSGSGLLGFLALKHGAKHVTFIEQNIVSYSHIRRVSEIMKINKSRYRIINDEFVASRWDEYDLKNPDMIVHELVGSYIWNDTIGQAFNQFIPNVEIIPNLYELKFSIIPLSESGFNYLRKYQNEKSIEKRRFLDVRVPIDKKFIAYYENVLNDYDYEIGIVPRIMRSLHDELFNKLYSKDRIEYYTHVFDINKEKDYKSNTIASFNLPKTDNPYLIFIHPYLHSKKNTLDFVESTSFSGHRKPILIPPKANCNKLRYDVLKNYMTIDDVKV